MNGIGQILSGLLLDFGGAFLETGGVVLAPETGGTSAVVGTSAAELTLDAGNALIFSGVVSTTSAISKTARANAEIQVNYSSNYDNWKANKPTSKTFGKKVSGRVKGKKLDNIRVDAEPNSGKIQVQSGSGKSGYDLDIDIEASTISSKKDIVEWVNKQSELKGLGQGAKEEIIKNMWKAFNWLMQ